MKYLIVVEEEALDEKLQTADDGDISLSLFFFCFFFDLFSFFWLNLLRLLHPSLPLFHGRFTNHHRHHSVSLSLIYRWQIGPDGPSNMGPYSPWAGPWCLMVKFEIRFFFPLNYSVLFGIFVGFWENSLIILLS